ncbi:MAG: uncharacterized protein K0R52_992 [Alphaproteobacteria bacterium]|jgi:RNase adaptor protein for sRNA GlmZ degradation|nr:uncharacterized protein [Alphaproteobacteria bacterium]
MVVNKNKPYIILITGASGSGKTAALKTLEQKLSSDLASINYFDDMGIPSADEMVAKYGSGEKWQEWAIHAWIDKLVQIADKKIAILEGSFHPEFAISRLQELGRTNYLLICLHATKAIREERLTLYRKQPELAIQDMENYAQVLKKKTVDLGGMVVDSTNRTIGEVEQEISNLIFKYDMESILIHSKDGKTR